MKNRKIETAAKLAALAMLGALGACATAADPHAMAVTAPAAGAAPAADFPAPLLHAMCVRTVTGGEATNPLWVSKVDNEGFHTAVDTSLNSAGLAAPGADSCHFPIDINLLGLSQPSMGLDMTVTSHVNYKVYDASGQPLLLETVDTPYTATFGDSVIGVIRLQHANEGAIRESIKTLFDMLRISKPK